MHQLAIASYFKLQKYKVAIAKWELGVASYIGTWIGLNCNNQKSIQSLII